MPLVATVTQDICAPRVSDLAQIITEKISPFIAANSTDLIGKRIALTAGSRGIDRIPVILRTLVSLFKSAQARPFIVPAMGSHGGASAAGQCEVLESLGITEESVGTAIEASMETVQIGSTPTGIPVFVDRLAADADIIIPVNRIKPHTEYKGEIESGLMKMLTIGLGKYQGATVVHNYALRQGYERVITDVALTMLDKLPILFGVGIVENCYDEVAIVEAIAAGEIHQQEKELLRKSRSLMMSLPFEKIDVLVIDEMGKNISGAGIDTNVIGRVMVYGQKEPQSPDIIRIVVLNLTPESHGNATGIGLADFTTLGLVKQINTEITLLNCVTACAPEKCRIPPALATDREAVECALRTVGLVDSAQARLVHIRNTLDLKAMEVSDALLPEVYGCSTLHVLEKQHPLSFTSEGELNPVPMA